MRQSNLYILLFSLALTVLLGGVLSFTTSYLRPLQQKQIELDAKKKIIKAVADLSSLQGEEEILSFYRDRFIAKVVDYGGNEVLQDSDGRPLVAERVHVAKNYKLSVKERLYPVFMFREDGAVSAYVFPMFGNGLWDWISGYIALSSDLNTVRGVSFDHKSETPGLGARITSAEVQDRYKGKKILDSNGNFRSVTMLKGERNASLDAHHVDGLSGATMTGKGVNAMLKEYLRSYSAFMDRMRRKERRPEAANKIDL